jgi:WXG100 family type VII secretion target
VSDPFTVDLARLAEMIEQLSSFDRYLEQALDEAGRRVDELHVSWSGEAASAQRAAHQEWVRGAEDMRAGLATMRAIAATAHGNYSSAVTTNTRMWEQIR